MSNNTKKIRIGIVFTVLLFIGLLFCVWFSFSKVMDNYKSIVSAKSDLALSKIQEQEVKTFKENYGNYLPNLQKIDQSIVDSENPLNFIEFLENSAARNGVALVLSPLTPSDSPQSKTLSVQISVKGDFDNILSFLNQVEAGPFLFSMYNLSFERVTASKTGPIIGPGVIQANIMANILAK